MTLLHVIYGLALPLVQNPGYAYQRWSRGHKARGQEHKKIRGQGQGQPFRGQTLSRPMTGMLEAKAKDTGASVLQKKVFKIYFQAISNSLAYPGF